MSRHQLPTQLPTENPWRQFMGEHGQRFKGSFLSDAKEPEATRGAATDFSKLPLDVRVQVVGLAAGVDIVNPAPAALTFVRRYPGWQPASL